MRKNYIILMLTLTLLLVLGFTDKNVEANAATYQIVKETYIEEHIKISYPQITGLGDSSKQTVINEMLKELALADCDDPDTSGLYLKGDCDIKWQSDSLLSVQYKGYRYRKGAFHPNNVSRTINIDIIEGSKIKLKDLVFIDENFVTKVRSGEFKAVDPIIKQRVKFSNEELIQDSEIGYFYFTVDSLGILSDVPHAAGDYVAFEVKYKDITDNIKPNQAIWRNFLPASE